MKEIRPVLVGMNDALVFVPMRVASRSRQSGMGMVVVTVVMVSAVWGSAFTRS